MCSIFGHYKLKQTAKIEYDINSIFSLMKHRGPDFENLKDIDKRCSLAHQRLSIIDVDNEANQPMIDKEDGIVFNGEIYNYLEIKKELEDNNNFKFKTISDTEVLLKGYSKFGTVFLNKLNGMFAFAHYNKNTKTLNLIRDRFGVKPLHYMIHNDILYFSSEIKPLIHIKKDISRNLSIFNSYFKHLATDYNNETFVQDIFQVRKGHYLEIKNNKVREKQWYFNHDFTFDESVFLDKKKTLEFVEDLLVDAIQLRMRADVPICLTLSGGIDSTVIYSLIKEKLQLNIKAFTFLHPNSPTNEYKDVLKLIKKYNDTVQIVSSNKNDSYEEVKKDLEIVEFPIWGISTRAYKDTYNSISSHGYKVVLEGHGSDEQLAGYPYMIDFAIYDYLKKKDYKNAYLSLRTMINTTNQHLSNFNTTSYRNLLHTKNRYKDNFTTFEENINWTCNFKILPIVLRAFDRLSMSSSIESRAPFMDYRIVEVFRKLPKRYKVNKIGNKAILREILKKYNIDFIYKNKSKMGFATDLNVFYSQQKNLKDAETIINNFSLNEFKEEKNKALHILQDGNIRWNRLDMIQKVSLIQLTEEIYKFNSHNKEMSL